MRQQRSKNKGVHCSFQAFCNPCGWQGSHWFSEGAAKNAHAEYRWHKEQQSHKNAEAQLAQEMDNRHLPIGPAACRE